jgi:hypothetical protein
MEDVPGIGQKYRYVAGHRDSLEILFVGSSRVFHHVIPERFEDRVGAATGHRPESFNFGHDGMWPPESYFVVRKLLELRPPKLKWVFIELMGISPKVSGENASTMRDAYWHDWPHTLLAWRAIPGAGLHGSKALTVALNHAAQLGSRMVNLGRAADWLARVLRPDEDKIPSVKGWRSRKGFEPDDDKVIEGAAREKFLETVAKRKASFVAVPLAPELKDAIAGLITAVRAAGAEPIFIVSPTLSDNENFTELPGGVPLISFADANRYAALYDPSLTSDGWHLNEKGAEIFTDLLAGRFIDLLRNRPNARTQTDGP